MISLNRKCQAYHWVFMLTSIEKKQFISPFFPSWRPPSPCTQQSEWSETLVRVAPPGPDFLHSIRPLLQTASSWGTLCLQFPKQGVHSPNLPRENKRLFPDEANLKLPLSSKGLWPVSIDTSEAGMGFYVGDLEHLIQQSSGKGPGSWEFIMVTS